MKLPDVNVLVYAADRQSKYHTSAASWLEETISLKAPLRIPSHVVIGVVRILTHPRIYKSPLTAAEAFSFIGSLQAGDFHLLLPGERYLEIFRNLSIDLKAVGNLIPDLHLAALALEHDCELVTFDRDFEKVTGLRTYRPR
ncbi:MAG: PIN domain-containing protein family protein [Puniceicoccaceae bacterium 5H]|nr:MAG: PIN domain-containing protein family protein [Puniceicoccaceae bacterium 5H]